MTNQEAKNVIMEVGRLRIKNNVKLYPYDAWFLFGVSNRIYNALVVTEQQKKYLLLILFNIKNNCYIKKKPKLLR